jgi:hypothetical protein
MSGDAVITCLQDKVSVTAPDVPNGLVSYAITDDEPYVVVGSGVAWR